MRKVPVFIFSCVLLGSIAFGADLDVASLDFDTLSELKVKVDQEYASRPEAQPINMDPGFYTAGIDIKPGTYYFGYVEPSGSAYSTARMHIYKDKATYESRPSANYGDYLSDTFFHLSDRPTDITLEEGNYIWLENNPLMYSSIAFEPTDYYTFEVPEGTLVEKGTYNVSSDIPEGKYTIYAADVSGGDVSIYYSETAKAESDYSQSDYYTIEPKDSMTVELKEGFIVDVNNNVIMKKASVLSFD